MSDVFVKQPNRTTETRKMCELCINSLQVFHVKHFHLNFYQFQTSRHKLLVSLWLSVLFFFCRCSFPVLRSCIFAISLVKWLVVLMLSPSPTQKATKTTTVSSSTHNDATHKSNKNRREHMMRVIKTIAFIFRLFCVSFSFLVANFSQFFSSF